MRENHLLAPHRIRKRPDRAHDGTITTEAVDVLWGTDMTQSVTLAEGLIRKLQMKNCGKQSLLIYLSENFNQLSQCQTIVRPIHDHYFDSLAERYNYLRQFVPDFLSTFVFRSNRTNDQLLAAIDILKQLNVNKQRKLPPNVPHDFFPSDWIKYVIGLDGKVDRRYYELCVLWELRAGLRSGNIYLSQSRRYANPETYLIPPTQWPQLRPKMCREMQAPEDGNIRLREREKTTGLVAQVSEQLAKNGEVRMEEGRLVVSKLSAEEVPERVTKLQQLIAERLPRVALSDVLIELDHWTALEQSFKTSERKRAEK